MGLIHLPRIRGLNCCPCHIWRADTALTPGIIRCNRPEYTPAELYPGLKRPRLDFTRVYYSLGEFIPPQTKLYTHDINHEVNSVERYTQELFNFLTSY